MTAAITGFGELSKREKISCPRRARRMAPTGVCAASSEISAPAMKARPAPVRMTPRTSSRARSSSIIVPSSTTVASFSALSLSGRLTVTVATPSATASIRFE